MIYTSYFARLRYLPNNVIPIAICGKAPDWYNGLQYTKLAPKYGFFMKWKENHDNEYYIEHFQSEVLDELSAKDVVRDLINMLQNGTDGYDIVLVCYERPESFCHRHLVADWLRKNGFECKEYEFGTK